MSPAGCCNRENRRYDGVYLCDQCSRVEALCEDCLAERVKCANYDRCLKSLCNRCAWENECVECDRAMCVACWEEIHDGVRGVCDACATLSLRWAEDWIWHGWGDALPTEMAPLPVAGGQNAD